MRNIIISALLTLIATAAFAQSEIHKLDFLLGEWSGESATQMGPGKPRRSTVIESVRAKAGAILIEGLGRRINDDGSIGEVVHDALGVISWDAAKKQYRFAAYTAEKGQVDAWMTVGENSAQWGFDPAQGQKIRYTIRLTEKGEWNEAGEFSRDGETWMKFFEMTLKKK